MVIPIFKKYRKRPPREKRPTAASPPPGRPPVLGEAYFDGANLAYLLFDNYDIELVAFDPSTITVNDPASGSLSPATSAFDESGFIVVVSLSAIGPSTGEQTLLNVSPEVESSTAIPAALGEDALTWCCRFRELLSSALAVLSFVLELRAFFLLSSSNFKVLSSKQ